MDKYEFDRQKWADMTIFEQMGNIGAEVGRALAAKRRGDEKSLQGALYRGLDLLDATAEIWAAKKPGRARELLRAREQFVDAATTSKNDTSKNDPALETYFMHFAIAARLHR